jgi:ATP-dependent RNA circularization protein (DNA/RNA ligase family)
VAIQGELIGPGIQGNIYKLSQPEFHVFDVYNVKMGQYLTPPARRHTVSQLGLTHVPVQWHSFPLAGDVDTLLAQAEGRSWLNKDQEREGIVFKEVNGGMSFKAISNKYLLGEK